MKSGPREALGAAGARARARGVPQAWAAPTGPPPEALDSPGGLPDRSAMGERIHSLAEAARAAKWELTQIAGRDALRIRAADGSVQTSFLTAAERVEIEPLLGAGPPTLSHPGLPLCTWTRGAFLGAAEDGTRITILDVTPVPDERALSQLSLSLARVRAILPRILQQAAEHLVPVARAWGRGPAPTADDIAKRLHLHAITLSPASTTVWLQDGGLFAGHAIEVSLDHDANVRSAALAG